MNLFESTFEKHKKLMLEKLSPELTQIQTKMSKIMNLPMGNAFVQYLQSAAKDPKVVQFLQAAKQDNATNDDAITVSGPTMLDVKNLRATQKEVFIGKSLEFPLKNKKFEQIKNFITTGQDAELNKSPIIVSGNFVIDGHHRWSQVFCWNKDAKIAAYDIRIDGVKNVEDVLKKMHLGVAATRGGLPLEDKPGAGNLFTMDDGTITKWLVMKILQYDAYQVFADPEVSSKMKSVIGNTSVNELTSKEDAESEQKKVQYIKTVVAPYICKNVADLKQNAGKFERKIMPQTGLDAQGKDANIQDFVKMMGSGNVNVDVTT